MKTATIALDKLIAHPKNANVLPEKLLVKLVRLLKRSGQYPPIIVREHPTAGAGFYEMIDGHHRIEAIRRIGWDKARCEIWVLDDQEAELALATLNRLHGEDDWEKRRALVESLSGGFPISALADLIPESAGQIGTLLGGHNPDDEPDAGEDAKKKSLKVSLFPTQFQVVSEAMAKARTMLSPAAQNSKNADGLALEMIAAEFLATYGATPEEE